MALSKEERKARKKARKEAKALALATEAVIETSQCTSTISDSTISTPKAVVSTQDASEAEAFLAKHSVMIHTPPGIPPVRPAISFSQLTLPSGLEAAFEGFREPTPIQACSWPPALDGKDVVGIAETGRYAFLLPL